MLCKMKILCFCLFGYVTFVVINKSNKLNGGKLTEFNLLDYNRTCHQKN